MLPTAPTIASQVMSASTAEPKSRNLPTKPASGGNPASESIDRVITMPSTGRARP